MVNRPYKKKLLTKINKIEKKVDTKNKTTKTGNKLIKKLDDDLRQLKIGSRITRKTGGATPYLETLLYPEQAFQAKIPGLADPTVSIHRKVTYNLTTNALGAAGICLQPMYMCDNSTATSTFFVNTNSTFDGVTTVGSAQALAITPGLAITAGAIKQWRLVSCSMHILPQASVLNQAGTIHGALAKVSQNSLTATGVAMANDGTMVLMPNYQNTPYYNCASVSAMEGLRLVWVPNDECYLEFLNINNNVNNAENGVNCPNSFVATIVGAVSAAFRVDVYWNYEVIPTTGSILQGMESVCEYNNVANSVWRKALVDHKHDICIANKAIKDVINIRQQNSEFASLGLTPSFGKPVPYNSNKKIVY